MAIRACNLIHDVFPFTSSWYRVNYTLGLSVMVPAYMQLMDGIVIVALSLTSHSDFFHYLVAWGMVPHLNTAII